MYRPHSRFGTLAKALVVASIAASWPGMLTLPVVFIAPALLLVPLAAFAIAFGHAFVLGLPLYLALERRGWSNGWWAASSGACIGAVPVLIYTALSYFEIPPNARPQPDAAAWWSQAAGPLGLFGFLGLCGGLAFFAVASGDGPQG